MILEGWSNREGYRYDQRRRREAGRADFLTVARRVGRARAVIRRRRAGRAGLRITLFRTAFFPGF